MEVNSDVIVCEVLCYFQNKISTNDHDYVIKSVVDFYNDRDIHNAKKLLFEKCEMTALRFKKYIVNAARKDCRDIIDKLNEVGVNCPTFVAKNIANLPLATPDAFDLAKLSNNISGVLKIEEQVMNSFATLSCLQKDFRSAIEKCELIADLPEKINDLKSAIIRMKPRHVIESDSSESESDLPSNTEADPTDHDDVILVSPVIHNVITEKPPTIGVSSTIPVVNPTHVLRLKDGPTNAEKWLTEDGFTMTTSNRKRTYGEVAQRKYKTVFTNSSRQRPEVNKLEAVPFVKRQNNHRNQGYNRSKLNRGQFELFVSRLVPGTESQTVTRYLRSKYNGDFKVEQMRAKYDDYCSFKITAPTYLKNKLLDRNNWGSNIYVRQFFQKSREY